MVMKDCHNSYYSLILIQAITYHVLKEVYLRSIASESYSVV